MGAIHGPAASSTTFFSARGERRADFVAAQGVHVILNVAMPKVGLDRPRIVSVVGELIAAGMPKHVGVGFDALVGVYGCSLDHAGEPWRR